ncbi:MAG: preprotein translocase subunit YajC [Alphaproteobacteria bacterium]
MLITPAYAQAAGGGSDALVSFLPIILIFVVFYFLLIRPQMRQRKEHQHMLGQLRRGDRVVTGGGIIGTITRATAGAEVTVEIAEGVKVSVARHTITSVLSKTDPAKGGGSKSGASVAPEPPKGLFGGLLGGRK